MEYVVKKNRKGGFFWVLVRDGKSIVSSNESFPSATKCERSFKLMGLKMVFAKKTKSSRVPEPVEELQKGLDK